MAMLARGASKGTSRGTLRRVWRTPTSRAMLYWGLFTLLICAGFYMLYFALYNVQIFTGPWFGAIQCGVAAYIMILAVAAYSLRRRFARSLPGKVQQWLWMHIWLGVGAVLLALLHADFRYVLHGYCDNLSCFTDSYWGGGALFALALVVVVGLIGRLLDLWQTHSIAREASTNGVGIAKAIAEHMLELEYSIERLCAGKSKGFQRYCLMELEQPGSIRSQTPLSLAVDEQAAFQHASEVLATHARLRQSLRLQERARKLMRSWRLTHITLAYIAFIIISYHVIMQLLTSVFHIL